MSRDVGDNFLLTYLFLACKVSILFTALYLSIQLFAFLYIFSLPNMLGAIISIIFFFILSYIGIRIFGMISLPEESKRKNSKKKWEKENKGW